MIVYVIVSVTVMALPIASMIDSGIDLVIVSMILYVMVSAIISLIVSAIDLIIIYPFISIIVQVIDSGNILTIASFSNSKIASAIV